MSKDYTKEIGYETLQSDFKRYQKQTPRGVGMTKKGQNIYLQFKTPNSNRKPYACNCTFTLDGMVDALKKAKLVSEALKTITSEVEFWTWYDKEVRNESQLVDDRITFGEAIKKVEDDFWNRLSRTKRKRDKKNPSDQKSWYRKYGCFFKHLPPENLVNLKDILSVVNKQKIGSSNYGEVVGTMKKLAIVNQRRDIYEALEALDTKQTIFMKLQNIDLEEFLEWRDKTLGITATLSPRCNMEVRKAWLWVFSAQIVYALRISEVIAIENLLKPYVTEDRKTIPALNDPNNTTNLIVIGEYTILNTTTKTGYRIAAPQVPPKYPDLMERLEIKKPLLPTNRPTSEDPVTIAGFWDRTARERLIRWDAPFTQTHADRNLGNINGIQAGIPQEVRAMSMGHTPAMNESNYKNRISTQTTIDLLLNSNTQAIDFVTAMTSVKKMLENSNLDRDTAIALLSVIYQKDSKTLSDLLA